jgi:hypothetical protein
MSRPTPNRRHFWVSLATTIVITVSGSQVVPALAQQYTVPDSTPTSAIPPNTPTVDNQLVGDRDMIPVNNPLFGNVTVYLLLDQTPIVLDQDYEAWSGPNATDEDNANAGDVGPVAAGSTIQPLFVRGTRVFSILPDQASAAWLETAPPPPPADSSDGTDQTQPSDGR